jgi:23S rRNA (adenine2503-C2)-methyltransferase
MKIIKSCSYSHNALEIEQMKSEVLQPIRDTKVSFELDDGLYVEAGIFELVTNDKKEIHACISSQAGCKFACTFCVSGRNGFKRNLTSDEILEEIKLLTHLANIDHFDRIMYMGVGEPLDNLDNVVASMKALFKLSTSYENNISLATIAVISKLSAFAEYKIPLRMLWVSLHSAFDEKRIKTMPVLKSVKITDIISSAVDFSIKTKTDTWLNYMILKGFNDQKEDALELVRLLRGTEDHLSLMITKPNGEVPSMIPGTIDDIYNFQELLSDLGLRNKSVRFFAAGNPVNAGCGEFLFLPTK